MGVTWSDTVRLCYRPWVLLWRYRAMTCEKMVISIAITKHITKATTLFDVYECGSSR